MKHKPMKYSPDEFDNALIENERLHKAIKDLVQMGDTLRNRISYTHSMVHTNCHVCAEIKGWDFATQKFLSEQEALRGDAEGDGK